MKSKTLLLTKTLYKNGEGFGVKGSKSTLSKVMLIALIAIIGPGMAAMVAAFIANAYDILYSIGQQGVIISYSIAISSLVIFIFGIFYIISTFYMSTDVESLIHLPLKPRQIIGAKFLLVTIYEYFITAVIFLPALLVYGLKSGAGGLFYLYGIVVFILIPILPLAVSSIIVMIIMRFVNISKHKDTLKLIGGLFAIIFALGINTIFGRFSTNIGQGELEEMLQKGNNSLINLTSNMFPSSKWAVQAIIDNEVISGLYNLLIYTMISILVYVLLILLGEIIYFKGVVGISEASSKRHKINKIDYQKYLVQGSVIKGYTLIELKLLFRTPIYFLNCVLVNFMWPLFMLFPLITQSTDTSMFSEIGNFLNNSQLADKVFAGAMTMCFVLGGTNGVAPTSISREGQELFVKKYIPVSYKDQITAKVLSSLIIGYSGLVSISIFAAFFFKVPIYIVLLVVGTGWLPILITSYIGVFIDIFNPKLNWDNEQKAVKQNMNVIYSMIIGAAFGALTMFIAFTLDINLILMMLIILAIYVAACFGLKSLLYTVGAERFSKL